MNTSYKIHCSICTGFEKVAMGEAEEKLGAKGIPPLMEKDSRGRIFIEVKASDVHRLYELRTVDSLYVVTKEFLDVDFSQEKEAAIKQLQALVPDFEWQTGMDVWGKYFSFDHPISLTPQTSTAVKSDGDEIQTSEPDNSIKGATGEMEEAKAEGEAPPKKRLMDNPSLPSFRCTCYRTGDGHPFQSNEVASAVGGSIQDYFGWNVNLKNHDIEVVLFVEDRRVRVCLALTRGSLHRRNLSHFGPTALRATVAAGLFRFAGGAAPGQVVCDPMCGGGSIPIEAAEEAPSALHICGDNHEKARDRVIANLEEFSQKQSRSLPINVLHWNATCLPLRTSTVDLFVVDLPYGKRSGSKFDNRRLYPAVLRELARVAVPRTGRACLLTEDRRTICQAMNKLKPFWRLTRQTTINVGGLLGGVYLLTRTLSIP